MPVCTATTLKGIRCKRYACANLDTCCAHSDDCAICLSKLGVGGVSSVFSCGHRFHEYCINTWFNQDNRCPCCRKELRKPIISVVTDVPFDHDMLTTIIRNCWDQGKLGSVRHIRLTFDDDTLYVQNLLTNDLLCRIPL